MTDARLNEQTSSTCDSTTRTSLLAFDTIVVFQQKYSFPSLFFLGAFIFTDVRPPGGMPESIGDRIKNTARRLYEIYTPQGWLQIYYPLYYLDKAIKKDHLYPIGEQRKIIQFAVPGAIASIVAWILWNNLRFVLRDLFIRKSPRGSLVSHGANQDDPPSYKHSINTNVSDYHLETDLDCGLSENEVKKRRQIYGSNELRTSVDYFYLVRLFSAHGVSLPLEISLLVAIILYDWIDCVILGSLLAYHIGTTGYSLKESHDVQRSLALEDKTKAMVIRESQLKQILASDLVPGDVVQISPRMTVPADLRLLRINEQVATDQSAITGQSTPVEKRIGDMLYYTTGVLQGHGLGMVTASAAHSFIGRTVDLLGGNPLQPNPEKRAKDVKYYIADYIRVLQAISALTCVTVITVLTVASTSKHENLQRFLEFALGIAILNVLTGRATVLQSLRTGGNSRLMAGKAIVQKGMVGAEALAGIDILISDKTGTLTANDLRMTEPYCINCTTEELLFIACLGVQTDENGEFTDLDPIDRAIVDALKVDAQAVEKRKTYKMIEFTPFDPTTKMITAVVESPDGERMTIVRGAPRAVFNMCKKDNPDTDEVENGFKEAATGMARKGYRSLGVARKRDTSDAKWELLGLTPLWDPPRDETASSIQLAKSIGIDVKMLTGDAGAIAQQIGKSIGLGEGEAFLAASLREYLEENPGQAEEDVVKKASEANVFCEAFPEDKEAIVKFFQNQSHRVAVSGDGASDQPALRRADCGIASEGASETAQSASDIVYLAPGLKRMIISAQISRQVLQQARTYLIYRTATAMHLAMILFTSYVMYGNSPADLRWFMVNVHISDVIGLQLSYDDNGRTPFSKKPARWRIGRVLATTLVLSAILIAGSFFTALATPDSADKNEITLAQQTVFLGASLTDPWLCLLLLTNGRFWTYISHWKSVGVILAIEIPGRLSYFGWAGKGMMNATIAMRIWLIGFGILGILAVVCWFAAESELVHKQVRFEEDEEEDDAREGTAEEAANLINSDTAA